MLRGGALGDFIVTLPALALLRERWPAARIELVGNLAAAQLAVARALLDAAHSQHEARWSALFDDAPLPAELAAWLAEFDLVINFWPDPAGELRRRFPLRVGQRFLHGDAMPGSAPAAAHYCAPLRRLGLEPKEFWWPLRPEAPCVNAGTFPHPSPQALIAIHPGSGSPRKNWPMENWLELIAMLPGPLALVLGEAEVERWVALSPSHSLKPRVADKSLHLLVNRPLEELVMHFARSRLFLGHDSGISHLAAASGAPCVLLFGPTEPSVWAPPAPNVRVLRRRSDLGSLSPDEVRRAAEAALSDRR